MKFEKMERAWLGGDGGVTNGMNTIQAVQFLLPGTVLDPRDAR